MPQTREHLSILDLLGIRNGAVAITKTDRVTGSRLREVENDVEALFSRTTLADARMFPVSAVTGEGIEDLKAHLLNVARAWRSRTTAGKFRLAIDRSFSVSGAGLIVTGTALAGSVSAGEHVRVLQAGFAVRARGIHAQNAASQTGNAGQRCAINLAGQELKPGLIQRGDWVVTGDVPEAAKRLDARIRVLESEVRPLAHWTPVHVHLGAADVTGRVAVLDCSDGGSGADSGIAPGASAMVQLVLDRPVGALYGDRLIIRDQSARRTIGGGHVIDIFPPVRGRAKPERLAFLAAMDNDDTPSAFLFLLGAAPRGLNLSRFAQNRNLTKREGAELFADASTRSVAASTGALGFSPENWSRLKAVVVETLASLHRHGPSTIPGEERVFLDAGLRLPKEVMSALVAELTKACVIIREPCGLRLRTHVPELSLADAALWEKTAPMLRENPRRPPTVLQIAGALAMDPKSTESFLVRVSRIGLTVRVAENRFFSPASLRLCAQFAEQIAEANGGWVTAARLRDCTESGRTLAIEILEYFDSIKFTRRIGDEHQVLRPAREVLGEGYNGVESRMDDTPVEEERTPVGRPDFKSDERR